MQKKKTTEAPAIPLGNNGLEVDLYEWGPNWNAWVYTGSYSLKRAIAACLESLPEQDYAVFSRGFEASQARL